MCIGIPMQIVSGDDVTAVAVAKGRPPVTIGMLLVGAQAPGTHVLVHLESAIRVIDAEEAELVARALEAADAAARGDGFEHLLADLISRTPELPPHLAGERKDEPTP